MTSILILSPGSTWALFGAVLLAIVFVSYLVWRDAPFSDRVHADYLRRQRELEDRKRR